MLRYILSNLLFGAVVNITYYGRFRGSLSFVVVYSKYGDNMSSLNVGNYIPDYTYYISEDHSLNIFNGYIKIKMK
jgi:hypothetical protein